ncbi:MAG TPA: hypothetical protein VFQ53_31685 [Kofleriaceae bacterium]|nr:hypothetical protein [Kofleriaceae bacterium]
MRIPTLFSGLVLSGLFAAACGGTSYEDESLYLTGTEEGAVTLANGQKACLHKKELICHIPPGNPENAHTICVSDHAVETHVSHHGDTIGACATEPTPPPDEPPPPDDDGGDGGTTPPPDAPPPPPPTDDGGPVVL